jgi:hypothetical protein
MDASAAETEELPLGVLLFIPARAMEAATMEGMARAGYTDMSVAQARIAARGHAAREAVLPALAEVEAQWLAHIGPERMAQLRETLTMLREITDPFLKDETP